VTDEKLIEEAVNAVSVAKEAIWRTSPDFDGEAHLVGMLDTMLAVFEKAHAVTERHSMSVTNSEAHTPTDAAAEREEIARIIGGHIDVPVSSRLAIARSIQGNGFARRPTPTDDEREALSEFLFTIYEHGSQPNALREAEAILAFLRTRRSEVVPEPSAAGQREALGLLIRDIYRKHGYYAADQIVADEIAASDLWRRRTEVSEPSAGVFDELAKDVERFRDPEEPEPSAERRDTPRPRDIMRAALRAAAEVTR